jgi:hypothetical protein
MLRYLPLKHVESTVKVSIPSDFGSGVRASHLRDRSLVLGGDDLLAYKTPS